MQFPYEGRIVNLLDTPGHADFGEDTYRVLTAVDSRADGDRRRQGRRGAHDQADGGLPPARHADHDLHQQARPRGQATRSTCSTRSNRVLGIQCAPVTWPIGMGKRLKGVVHLVTGEVHLYEPGRNFTRQDSTIFPSLDDPGAGRAHRRARCWPSCATNWSWCRAPRTRSTTAEYLAGRQTPVFFGSAVNNFGVQLLLDFFVEHAPAPRPRATTTPRGRARRSRSSPASCSRSRPTWTRSTATASRSCACARASSAPA